MTATRPAPANAMAAPTIAYSRAFLASLKRDSLPADVTYKNPAYTKAITAKAPIMPEMNSVIFAIKAGKSLIQGAVVEAVVPLRVQQLARLVYGPPPSVGALSCQAKLSHAAVGVLQVVGAVELPERHNGLGIVTLEPTFTLPPQLPAALLVVDPPQPPQEFKLGHVPLGLHCCPEI